MLCRINFRLMKLNCLKFNMYWVLYVFNMYVFNRICLWSENQAATTFSTTIFKLRWRWKQKPCEITTEPNAKVIRMTENSKQGKSP